MTDSEPGSRSGTSFGHYQLIRLVGRGGMGEVYEAEDTRKRRRVALKLISQHLSGNPTFRARMEREAGTAGRLTEPHVVPIHDYGEIDGQLYVDMRLIEGTDLRTVLTRFPPLRPPRVVAIALQVAGALDAAHAANVVHRDVKPENILLTDNDFAYLVDFGVARAASDAGLTQGGATVGTYDYMAPERFSNDEVTYRADVYALACVMFECLTGSRPYRAENIERLITAHLMDPVPRPSERRPGTIPAALDDVIVKGMAKKPEERYGSAGELARAAHEALTAPEKSQADRILQQIAKVAPPPAAAAGAAAAVGPKFRFTTPGGKPGGRSVSSGGGTPPARSVSADAGTKPFPSVNPNTEALFIPTNPGTKAVGANVGPAAAGAETDAAPSEPTQHAPIPPSPPSKPSPPAPPMSTSTPPPPTISTSTPPPKSFRSIPRPPTMSTSTSTSTPPPPPTIFTSTEPPPTISTPIPAPPTAPMSIPPPTLRGFPVPPFGSKGYPTFGEPPQTPVDQQPRIQDGEPKQRSRRKLWILVGAVALVVIAVVGTIIGINIFRPSPTPQSGPISLPFNGLHFRLSPGGVAVDGSGNVYVTNQGIFGRVVKLAPGSSSPTEMPFQGLYEPQGLAVDSDGAVYVTDFNQGVTKLAPGSNTQVVLPFPGVSYPESVAVDAGGTVYVADRGTSKVYKLPRGATEATALPFNGLKNPDGVAVDASGNVYVTDSDHDKVLKLAPASETPTELPFNGLTLPWGVAVDSAGNVYVTDHDANKVMKSAGGSSPATALPFTDLNTPLGVAVDSSGNVYVADRGNDRVVKLPNGS